MEIDSDLFFSVRTILLLILLLYRISRLEIYALLHMTLLSRAI